MEGQLQGHGIPVQNYRHGGAGGHSVAGLYIKGLHHAVGGGAQFEIVQIVRAALQQGVIG
ncbi:hypothetical protein SDC9_182305 [bioreactor metagenome]|uniref:Uncharacterized protein n=1 Tax=bioreactor metagenome TaxID=1076179 RepID=A0A645H713_9ZZZZ